MGLVLFYLTFFLIKSHDNYEYGYGGDEYREICIKYSDVNEAVSRAIHRLNYVPPEGLNSLEPPLPSIAASGELMLETTRLLAYQ